MCKACIPNANTIATISGLVTIFQPTSRNFCHAEPPERLSVITANTLNKIVITPVYTAPAAKPSLP